MPPLNQPKTLYAGCLNFVNFMIDLTCETLAEEDEEYLEYRITQLQEMLSKQLPPAVLDDICENRRLLAGRMSTAVRICEIKLRVYMHSQMRHFKIDTGSHECHVALDDTFWQRQIYQMSRIQTLDLHLVCTDEILEIVSNFCPNLQEINIVSRVVQETSTEPPTLRIKQFVSDYGLMQLTKCRNLRCIVLNRKPTTKYSVGRFITSFGVQNLLQNLPRLEYINYGEMGEVFQDINLQKPTHLTTLIDSNPQPETLDRVLYFCPYAQYLYLSIPKEARDNEVRSQGILEYLGNCPNQITRIELQGLHTFEYLEQFLGMKGQLLTVLSLNDPRGILTSREIAQIGNYCPDLTQLSVRDLASEQDTRPMKLSASAFRKLKHLNISGKQWNFKKILCQILAKAQNLEKLALLNLYATSYELDDVLNTVLKEGHLRSVQELNLKCGCYVSLSFVKRMLKKCKRLESITVRPNALLQKSDADTLLNSYLQKNYRVLFNFDV